MVIQSEDLVTEGTGMQDCLSSAMSFTNSSALEHSVETKVLGYLSEYDYDITV